VSLLLALVLGTACPASPAADADGFVRGLVEAQRRREEALSLYTYDVTEVREKLDGEGRVKSRSTKGFEVFYVRGRPVRRLVSRDGQELPPKERAKEDRRARELASDLREGRAAVEQPGTRISRILERYHFEAAGGEWVDGRCTLAFDFAPRAGDFDLERDAVLRRLAGRLLVDEAEHAVVRLDVRNTEGLKFALGIGAKVRSLAFHLELGRMPDGVWLPRRLEIRASGRKLLLFSFDTRSLATFGNYRRFGVEVEEKVEP
jgi:hypothetical protein